VFVPARTPDDHHLPPDTGVGLPRRPTSRPCSGRMARTALLTAVLLALAGCGAPGQAGREGTAGTGTSRTPSPESTVRPTRSTAPPRTTAPEPVRTEDPAPEPVPDAVDPAADPGQFLGTTYEDQAFLDYLTVNDCYRGVAVRLVCPDVGVEFAVDGSHRVSAVFYAPGYAGELPGGVAFGDTPEEVLAQVGEPHSSTSTSMTWWVAEDVRLIVSFPVDPAAGFTVNQVSLQAG
jgi:hypothetical protein